MKLLLLLLTSLILVSCNKYTKDQKCTKDKDGNEQCEKKDEYEEDDDEGPEFYEEEGEIDKWKGRERLFQWDPIRAGYERNIQIAPDQTVTMVTAAVRPKAFLIDNFLTDAECDHVINKALNNGLYDSGLHIDPETRKSKKYTYGFADSAVGVYRQWDRDGDGQITIPEIIRMAQVTLKLYIKETDVKEMFKILEQKQLDDDIITRDEFQTMNTAGISEYMKTLREENPRFRDRFSEQIWLRQGDGSDRIMQGLREKVIKLTNLPPYIIEGGEALQVVRYKPFGHYHAHFDGQDGEKHPEKKICCHMDPKPDPSTCKICRFITILYYLNDVEEGGQTAFPVADEPDYDHEKFRMREKDDLYNLSNFCHNASLVVQAKKGRAIMWYNHDTDENGWLGKMDYYGLHGGCDIVKGNKWIANNWLVAPPSDLAHIDSLYLNFDELDAEAF